MVCVWWVCRGTKQLLYQALGYRLRLGWKAYPRIDEELLDNHTEPRLHSYTRVTRLTRVTECMQQKSQIVTTKLVL